MLSKDQRLSRTEFAQVFESGKRTGNSAFIVISQKSTEPKVAVVISKKILSGAVLRNKLRRTIFNLLKECEISKDTIILVKKPALDLDQTSLKESLQELIT